MFGEEINLPISSANDTNGVLRCGLVNLDPFIVRLEEILEEVTDDIDSGAEEILEELDVEEEEGGIIDDSAAGVMEHLYLQVSFLDINAKILLPDSQNNVVQTRWGRFVPLSQMLDYLLTFDSNLTVSDDDQANVDMLKAEFNRWQEENILNLTFEINSAIDLSKLPQEQRGLLDFLTSDENFNFTFTGGLETGNSIDQSIISLESESLTIPESNFAEKIKFKKIELEKLKLKYSVEESKIEVKAKKGEFTLPQSIN